MIKLLDCTLRDGGYINNWKFGENNINYIISNLNSSNVDFIELGYLDSKKIYDSNYSKYNTLNDMNFEDNKKYLCMINYGDFDIDSLPEYNDDLMVRGIRLAFHKKDYEEAMKCAEKIKEKGYIVFIQPMVTSLYSEEELDRLVNDVNKLQPYALYFADSFGTMKEEDVSKYIDKFDNNVDEKINLGFHSHNNLQLSLSNVSYFIKNVKKHNVIIDSTVYGMGRGAGNLATELIVDYLNKNYDKNYDIDSILNIVSEVLFVIRQENYWGYSIPFYISAINNCHPNYAKFLSDKQTININDINKIMHSIDGNHKYRYDKTYIEELYEKYMNHEYMDKKSYEILRELLRNKDVLLIGPGKSVDTHRKEISDFAKRKDVFSVSVNHINELIKHDSVFISNRKRYDKLRKYLDDKKLIVTSNIECDKDDDNILIFDYEQNLLKNNFFSDMSLFLLLSILSRAELEKTYLAGFDGFEIDNKENYYNEDLLHTYDRSQVQKLNDSMRSGIDEFAKKMELKFITPTIYKEN